MARDGQPSPARALLDQLAGELRSVEDQIRSHRFVEAVAVGEVPRVRLAALAGEQHAVVASDRRSFACLAARFPAPPAGDLFLALAGGEGEARRRLAAFAAAVGLDADALRSYEPHAGGQAYPAFVAWLALNGSRSDVALAFLVNLAAWGANCARIAAALRERYGLAAGDVAFFDFFAEPPRDLHRQLLDVLDAGLAEGDSPICARRAARLLQSYELLFWDALADELP